MANVGWWAEDTPLYLGNGRRYRRGRGEKPLYVSTAHRLRHLYGIGSSGSGKSRLIRFLITQDIDANRGFTLLDAQDLQAEVLAYIAEKALPGRPTPEQIAALGDKLVLIEPADQRFGAPCVNLLHVRPGQVGYQVVDSIIEVIKEIWPDTYGPRLEDICRHALLLLQELRLTVLEILPLLSDEAFRATLVARSHNPDIRLYFQEHLGGLRPAELKTWVESSRNKWSAFLSNPFIRPILGSARSTIDFKEIIDQGKWLIVNVSRDKLKESRRLLGALIIALIHQAALSREHLAPEQRITHFIWVDEFQEFWTPTFLHILEAARKYAIGLSIFHQALRQPPFDTQTGTIDTILSNAHTRIAFNVSHQDGVRLGSELFYPTGAETKFQQNWLGIPSEEPRLWGLQDEREHYAGELMRQQPTEGYVSFKGMGHDEPYAVRVPHVADIEANQEKIDALRRHVASKYYRPVPNIEEEIEQRWARIRQGQGGLGRDYTQ